MSADAEANGLGYTPAGDDRDAMPVPVAARPAVAPRRSRALGAPYLKP